VGDHLETCLDCQKKLDALAANSQCWEGVARHLGQGKESPEAALQQAMDALKGAPNRAEAQAEPTPHEDVSLGLLDPPAKPGQLGKINHYEIVDILGRGGMGVVFKAFDPELNRFVAIKCLAPQLATSATARARFRREAQAAAAVSHEHVVAIHAVSETRGIPYLVMEYIRGVSLQERIERTGPLGLKEILRIGSQAARGLAAAHAQGLIHRDIKPGNILLENGIERVKLTDFGLARAGNEASLTTTGVLAGTPGYMAPEQARGEVLDSRSDLFSLGSVLYTLCTGRPPFRAHTTLAVLKRVCEDTPAPIPNFNPDIPDWLVAVVEKLHAKDPADRFQSAAEAAGFLEQCLAHVQQPAQTPLPSLPKVRPSFGRSGPPWSWRRLAGLAAGLFAVVFAALVIYVRTRAGLLEITVDDPQMLVTIDGDEDVVLTGAGPRALRLSPGQHQLRGSKDGMPVKIEPDWVTIKNGSKELVRVRMILDEATIKSLDEKTSRVSQPYLKDNLVANPGFEDASDPEGKEALYWIAATKTTPLEPEARCYRDTSSKLTGKASVIIEKAQTKLLVAEAGFMQMLTSLPAGQKLYLSGAIKTRDVRGSASIKLRLVNEMGIPIRECATPPVSATTDWKRYAGNAVEVPAGARGELALVIQGTGTVWFDDIYVGTSPDKAAASPASASTNLLRNGGFETLINNEMPQDWDPVGLGVKGLAMKADRDIKHGGKASATTINTGADAEPYNWRQDITDGVPTGKTVELTGWVRTKEVNLAAVGVQLLDVGGRLVAFHTTQNKQEFKGTADWQPFTLRFPVPKDTVRVGVLAILMGRGQVWFDDFQLVVDEAR
jgi:serine/threonine protein kinase